MTTRSVAALISYGTLWHPRPGDNCEVSGNERTTEKNWEQAQIIESGFRKQFNAIGKTDQIGKGQNGQFTLREYSCPKCPFKCKKLNFEKSISNEKVCMWKKGKRKWK